MAEVVSLGAGAQQNVPASRDISMLDDAWRAPFRAAPDGTVRAQLGLDKDTRLRLHNPNACPVTVASALAKVALLNY